MVLKSSGVLLLLCMNGEYGNSTIHCKGFIVKYLTIVALLAIITTAAMATELEPWQNKGTELAKAEPKIMDAVWSQKISFWISVKDDGTDRTSFADYVCLLLNDAGRPQGEFIAITVWDAMGQGTDNPIQLGKSYCE